MSSPSDGPPNGPPGLAASELFLPRNGPPFGSLVFLLPRNGPLFGPPGLAASELYCRLHRICTMEGPPTGPPGLILTGGTTRCTTVWTTGLGLT